MGNVEGRERRERAVVLLSNDLSHPSLSRQQYAFSWRINRLRPLLKKGRVVIVVAAGGAVGRNGWPTLNLKHPVRNDGRMVLISPPILRIPMLWLIQSMIMTPLMVLIYCRISRLDVEAVVAASVPYGAVGKVLNRFLNTALIVDYGDPDFAREQSVALRVLLLLETYVLGAGGVDAVTCIDPNISKYVERYGVKDAVFLPPGGFWKDEIRKETPKGNGEKEKVVLYAGHVAPPPTYRLDLLVEAAPIVLEKHPETKFIVVGDGSFADRMKVRARQLGVAERFEFTGGVPFSEAKAFMGRADVCVQLLNDMCLGTKVIDYFAMGKPVLSCGRFYDRYHEFLENGENCILVPPSPAGIAEGLDRLLSDDQLRRRLGERAFETVQGWDWENQARMLLGLIPEHHRK